MSFERYQNRIPNKIGFDFVYESLSNLINIFSEEEKAKVTSEPVILELMSCLHEYFAEESSHCVDNTRHISLDTRKKIIKIIETDLPEIEMLFRNSNSSEFQKWVNSRFDL